MVLALFGRGLIQFCSSGTIEFLKNKDIVGKFNTTLFRINTLRYMRIILAKGTADIFIFCFSFHNPVGIYEER